MIGSEMFVRSWRIDEIETQHREQQGLQHVDEDDGAGNAGEKEHRCQDEQALAGIEASGRKLACRRRCRSACIAAGA